jgi:DNA (cytosine-5)-methyltransferase 1
VAGRPDRRRPRPSGRAALGVPDCKHFSKAKGGKPVARNIRDLAWVVVLWARRTRPRVIILENVEEFRGWGPLIERDGRLYPDPERIGETFDKWSGQLKRLGYKVEWQEMRACDYGAPTTRKRLFLIARRDGKPIVWPKPTHGAPTSPGVIAGKLLPWRTAAEVIDWSLPCPSIFDTAEQIKAKYGVRAQRPLADATMARIAKGVKRYVLDAASPFIIPVTHAGDSRVNGIDQPLPTQTTAHRGEHAVVMPHITKFNRGAVGHPIDEPLHTITSAASDTHGGGACPLGLVAPVLVKNLQGDKQECRVDEPLRTILTGNQHLLVAAFLAQHNGGMVGVHSAREPVSTLTKLGTQQQVVAAHLLNLRGADRRGGPIDVPAPTFSAGGNHAAAVAAFLVKYYGAGDPSQAAGDPMHSLTTKPRHGLVTVDLAGEPWVIVDIGMRMLTPRERFNAQGFPPDYLIDVGARRQAADWARQGRLVGNSVCPPIAAALVAANCADLAAGVARFEGAAA